MFHDCHLSFTGSLNFRGELEIHKKPKNLHGCYRVRRWNMVKRVDFCCSSNLFYAGLWACPDGDPLIENWNLKIHPKAFNILSNDDTSKSNQHLVQIDVPLLLFQKNAGIFSLWVFVEAKAAILKVHLQRNTSPLGRPWGQWWRFWNPCLSWFRLAKRSKNIQRFVKWSEDSDRCFWMFLVVP